MKKFSASLFVAALTIATFLVQPHLNAVANAPRTQVYSTTKDFGNLVDGAGETAVVTATNAALGDACVASVGVDLVDMTLSCYIQAAGLAEVRLQNESGAGADLASTTLRVYLLPALH